MTCPAPITNNGMVSALRELLPNINPTIADLTYETRTFLYDMIPMKTIPYYNGDTFFKQIYYGYQPSLPFQQSWQQVRKSSPGTSHEPAHDACGTKWNTVKDGAEMVGYGLEKKSIRTESFCLDDWAYAHYAPEFIQGKIDSLAGVVQGELENYAIEKLFTMAQKFVVTSQGFRQAKELTTWPSLTGVTISRLSIDLFTKLHTRMLNNRVPSALTINGGKAYFAVGNAEDIADFLYHDPELRQDSRYGTMGSIDLLTRYSITDQLRGLFAFVNYNMIPRANIVGGEVIYVFPYTTDVATQLGVRNAPNEAYYTARYFTVLFVGKSPAAIIRPTGTESMTEAFRPKNPDFNWDLAIDLCSHPKDNVVWFWTEATLGWEPGNYPYVYVGLFERRQDALMAAVWPDPTCIEPAPECDDGFEAPPCPCPQIVGTPCIGETNSELVFTFDVAPAGYVVTDPISIRLANGSVASGEVAGISADGIRIRVDFGTTITVSETPGWYVELLCGTVGGCYSEVAYQTNCSEDDEVSITTFGPIVAVTAGDLLHVTFCDGFETDVALVSNDLASLTLVVEGDGSDSIKALICEHGKICTVCVVPTAYNDCPACDTSTLPCVEGDL